MRKPEHVAKLEQGPIGIVTVFPNGADFGMGRQLATWFVFCLVVGLFSGYVAAATLAPGTPYLKVFQVVGATAFMGYSLALYELSIWYRRGWDLTLKGTLDGLIYACVTAGAFGWLWPA